MSSSDQSHIQALTALIQAHDRINPLEPAAEAWRHEAYKLSVQKKAIENEASHQVHVIKTKHKTMKESLVYSLDQMTERLVGNVTHRLTGAWMMLELRLDRLQVKLEDRNFSHARQCNYLADENRKLRSDKETLDKQISDLRHASLETEQLKEENNTLRRILADRKSPSISDSPVGLASEPDKSAIGNLLAELKALETEARRLDYRSK